MLSGIRPTIPPRSQYGGIGDGVSQPPENQILPNSEGYIWIPPCFADIYRCKATENFNFFLSKNLKMFLALASTQSSKMFTLIGDVHLFSSDIEKTLQ